MRFQQEKDPDEGVSIELTPLVDIIFLLLIFFLLTTTFSKSGIFKVELPEASASKNSAAYDVFKIIITEDGVIVVDNEEYSLTELKEKIKKEGIIESKRPVVVFADEGAKHGRVIEVLDMLKFDLGLKDVSVATKFKGR